MTVSDVDDVENKPGRIAAFLEKKNQQGSASRRIEPPSEDKDDFESLGRFSSLPGGGGRAGAHSDGWGTPDLGWRAGDAASSCRVARMSSH